MTTKHELAKQERDKTYERRENFARNSPTVMAFDWTYQYQFP